MLITADQGLRGGKVINLKRIADDAITQTPSIQVSKPDCSYMIPFLSAA
jgi:acyl-coenzyme A synthetase/AMP-(fatty) acid ligase